MTTRWLPAGNGLRNPARSPSTPTNRRRRCSGRAPPAWSSRAGSPPRHPAGGLRRRRIDWRDRRLVSRPRQNRREWSRRPLPRSPGRSKRGGPWTLPPVGIAADSLAPKRVGEMMFPLAQAFVGSVALVSGRCHSAGPAGALEGAAGRRRARWGRGLCRTPVRPLSPPRRGAHRSTCVRGEYDGSKVLTVPSLYHANLLSIR